MQNKGNFFMACCLLGLSLCGHAETKDRLQAMTIDADRVSVDELKKTSLFSGHVVMTQGTLVVKADKVSFRQTETGEFYVTAQGKPINFRQKQDNSPEFIEAFAEQLEFDSKADQLHLMRQAVLRHGKDEVRGESISYNMQTQQYEVTGSKSVSEANAADKRVRLVIQPRVKTATEAPSADVPVTNASGVKP